MKKNSGGIWFSTKQRIASRHKLSRDMDGKTKGQVINEIRNSPELKGDSGAFQALELLQNNTPK